MHNDSSLFKGVESLSVKENMLLDEGGNVVERMVIMLSITVVYLKVILTTDFYKVLHSELF